VSKTHFNGPDGEFDTTVIADLKQAVKDLILRRKQPGEGLMIEARQLAQQWKVRDTSNAPERALFDGSSPNTTLLLAALVVLFRRDHELVKEIRRHLRNKSENRKLSGESFPNDPLVACLSRVESNITPKQAWERNRRRKHFHLIEWEYGDDLKALFSKVRGFDIDIASYEGVDMRVRARVLCGREERLKDPAIPTCLDNIFRAGLVNMLRLEELFGRERHQFPKNLPNISKGRETFYDYRAVVTIMNALLTEKSREKSGKSGRPPRIPWLNDARLRMRVLSGIETRINSLSVQDHIKAAFLSVVGRHLPDSGKKAV
jgi:hypothetical protein